MDLEIKHDIACGLDVHFASIVACLVKTGPKGGPKYETRSFSTNRAGLLELLAWIQDAKCPIVGMEATGVYWMPVYAILEGHVALVVGNPTHMKALRGHKTDRKDAKWIAGLVRHDLISASYVPTPEFRDARELTRRRRNLVCSRSEVRNEILRGLALVGIPLADVISDVFGVSGMRILEALVKREPVIDQLTKLVHGSMKHKIPLISAALSSSLTETSLFLLEMGLKQLEGIEMTIKVLEERIFSHFAPHKEHLDRLMTIPGIAIIGACGILAEIGLNMSQWPTERHLSSWAGLAPGNRESGGKRRRAGIVKGNTHLTTIMVEAATSAVKSKKTFLSRAYYRLRSRMGHKKAVVAIARKMLVLVYRMLNAGLPYKEPAHIVTKKAKKAKASRYIKNLEELGFEVTVKPKKG